MSALLICDTDGRGAKVLVAEDHEDTRQMLRTLLERRGLSVVEAGDGFEAVTLAERERPDLILMDGGLPLLDGIGVTRHLRAVPALSAVPIVFVSGHASQQDQKDALVAGCDEYLVKPFDIAQLDTVLNRHLHVRSRNEGVNPSMTQTGTVTGIRGGAAGSGQETATARRLFGLVELDEAGTVLYTRIEPDGAAPSGSHDYTGRNFYTEVAHFRNVDEFRNRLDDFRRGSQPAHSIDFTCDYEDGPVLVRVLLARIRERTQADVTKSILVHIRRAQ